MEPSLCALQISNFGWFIYMNHMWIWSFYDRYLIETISWSWRWLTQGEAQPLHGYADPCEFPGCGNVDFIISGGGGLRFALVFIGGIGSGGRAVAPMIGRSVVWFPALVDYCCVLEQDAEPKTAPQALPTGRSNCEVCCKCVRLPLSSQANRRFFMEYFPAKASHIAALKNSHDLSPRVISCLSNFKYCLFPDKSNFASFL